MREFDIVQGDQRPVSLRIRVRGEPLTDGDIKTVEVMIGALRKCYPGSISYSNGKFTFMLTQQETFALPVGNVPVLVRVARSGFPEVLGKDNIKFNVRRGASREVL